MHKVLISTSSFAEYDSTPLKMLRKSGLSVKLNPLARKLTETEINDLIKDSDYLIAGTEPLNRRILESAKKLKIISRCGTGMENIDMEAAKDLGIKVFNTPDASTQAVAELTICFMLGLLRRVMLMDKKLRKEIWKKEMGNLLTNKNVGIIGFGRVGQRVAELLSIFGVKIGYYDKQKKVGISKSKRMDFKSLLSWADIVSIHASSTKNNSPIISKKEFKLMKPGSWLINVARGGLIDEKTLCDELRKGRIAGAAIDVFEEEPYRGPLIEFENVILTPHIGSYAKESRIKMEIEAVSNLLKAIKSDKRK